MLSISDSRTVSTVKNTSALQSSELAKSHSDGFSGKIDKIGNNSKIRQTHARVNKFLQDKDIPSILSSLQSDVKGKFQRREGAIRSFIKKSINDYCDSEALYGAKEYQKVNLNNSKTANRVLRSEPENIVFVPDGMRPNAVRLHAYEENKVDGGIQFVGGFRANESGKVVDSYDVMDAGCYPLSTEHDPVYNYAKQLTTPKSLRNNK